MHPSEGIYSCSLLRPGRSMQQGSWLQNWGRKLSNFFKDPFIPNHFLQTVQRPTALAGIPHHGLWWIMILLLDAWHTNHFYFSPGPSCASDDEPLTDQSQVNALWPGTTGAGANSQCLGTRWSCFVGQHPVLDPSGAVLHYTRWPLSVERLCFNLKLVCGSLTSPWVNSSLNQSRCHTQRLVLTF